MAHHTPFRIKIQENQIYRDLDFEKVRAVPKDWMKLSFWDKKAKLINTLAVEASNNKNY